MIRAILFDADGVLQHHGPFFDEDWVWPAERHRDLFRRIWSHPGYPGCLEGRSDFAAVCAAVLAESGWETCGASDYLLRWMRRGMQTDPVMLAWVAELRRAGFGCHLATNQEDVRAEFLEREVGYGDLFDSLFISCRMGAAKPDPAYFARIAEALDAPTAQVAFFDDKPENVEAAARLGFAARLFTDRASFSREIHRLTGVGLSPDPGDAPPARARLV